MSERHDYPPHDRIPGFFERLFCEEGEAFYRRGEWVCLVRLVAYDAQAGSVEISAGRCGRLNFGVVPRGTLRPTVSVGSLFFMPWPKVD